MTWFTKYVKGLMRNVNGLFNEKGRLKRKEAGSVNEKCGPVQKKGRKQSVKRTSLEVTCCTGKQVRLDSTSECPLLSEDDFKTSPTVVFPKAKEGSLYSFLLVDLQGHTSLHAKSHRLAWVQHNIPGAAFAEGDFSAGTVCTPYRPPFSRRGSLHVLVLVFEQCRAVQDVSPVFAEDCRLSLWLSRFGASASRMVVCEELQTRVERSLSFDSTDCDARSTSSGDLELPTVTFHKLESPSKHKHSPPQFVFDEQNGWIPVRKGRPLDSPSSSPRDCPKRIKVI